MLKELSDLPKHIDAFIEGIILFFYRVLKTYWTILSSPVFGAVRAKQSRSMLKPATALFIGSLVISYVSIATPDERVTLLSREDHLILRWTLYAFVMFLVADALAHLSATIGAKRKRIRVRAVSVSRYAIAGTYIIYSIIAFLNIRINEHLSTNEPHEFVSAVKSFLKTVSILQLDMIYLVGCCAILWVPKIRKPFVRKILPIFIFLFGFFMFAKVLKTPLFIETVVRAITTPKTPSSELIVDQELVASRPISNILNAKAVLCNLVSENDMKVEMALLNEGDQSIVIRPSNIEISIFTKESTILNPEIMKSNVVSESDNMIVISPGSAHVFVGNAYFETFKTLKANSSCFIDYQASENHANIRIDGSGQIIP